MGSNLGDLIVREFFFSSIGSSCPCRHFGNTLRIQYCLAKGQGFLVWHGGSAMHFFVFSLNKLRHFSLHILFDLCPIVQCEKKQAAFYFILADYRGLFFIP